MGIPDEILEPDPSFWTKTSWIQLGYGFWVNMTLVGVGMSFGFSAVAVPQLAAEDSVMKITVKEQALITSVLTLFSPIGCILCGILQDRCGRKTGLILCQVPSAFGWFYMGFAVRAKDLIVGRIITGIGVGMSMNAPRTYLSEISLPNMRGVLGAIPYVANSMGLTFQAVLGSFLRWYILCYICGAFTVSLFITMFFIPETPYYTIMKGNTEDAKVILKKLRAGKFNLDNEIKKLEDFKKVNKLRSLSPSETFKFLFSKQTCKPFAISVFYITLAISVGINVLVMWTIDILKRSKSTIDPHVGNIVLNVTRIVFSIVSSIFIYKFKRRTMALSSAAVGLGFVCVSLGVFLHNQHEPSPYPLLFYIGYTIFAALGYNPMPMLLMSEIVPLQVRGTVSGMVLTLMCMTMFFMNRTYPTIHSVLGFENMIILWGTLSLLGAIILYVILPETKDLTLQEIEEYFRAIRPSLVSRRQVMSMQLLNNRSELKPKDSKFNKDELKEGKNKQIDVEKVSSKNTNRKFEIDDDPDIKSSEEKNEFIGPQTRQEFEKIEKKDPDDKK